MGHGYICSLAHRRKKTECGWHFSIRLAHAADTDVESNAARHRSDAHNLGEEIASAAPRRRSRLLKGDFQLISQLVFAVTAEAHALRRNVHSHGLFKPGNPLRMHADGNRESLPHATAPFGFVPMDISVS